jgi:hypothetical protein
MADTLPAHYYYFFWLFETVRMNRVTDLGSEELCTQTTFC